MRLGNSKTKLKMKTIYISFYKQLIADVLQKSVLKNFAIFTEERLCWSLFLIKLRPKAYNFIKKKLQQRCFPVNIAKFWRKAFFIEHLWWLLLSFKTLPTKGLPEHRQSLFLTCNWMFCWGLRFILIKYQYILYPQWIICLWNVPIL